MAWCDANLKFRRLTGTDLYRIRRGVLHQGHFGHPKARFDRVIFNGPESNIKADEALLTVTPGTKFGGVEAEKLRLSGQILMMDAGIFCRKIMAAARAWSIAKASDANVQRNLPNLVRFRPHGMPPFSVGVPTIA